MDEITEPGSVEVNLDPTPEVPEEDKFGKLSEQLEKLNKTVNYLSANRRHDDKLAKRVDEIYEKMNAPEPEIPPVEMDELDQLAQKDWKKAVSLVAEQIVERKDRERRETENAIKIQNYQAGILEQSKSKVRDRHPDIETDPASDKARMFTRILEQNPDYINNPRGPELAMRDMEEELRQKGHLDPSTAKLIEKEADRRTRVVRTSVSRDKAVSEGKITLSKDDQEFCKLNNISFEDFAKNKKTLSGGDTEGVTVNG